MRKKVRRSLALFLTLAMMMSMIGNRELFVSAENAGAPEQISSAVAEDAPAEESSQTEEILSETPDASVPEEPEAVSEETPEEAAAVLQKEPEESASDTGADSVLAVPEEQTPKAESVKSEPEAIKPEEEPVKETAEPAAEEPGMDGEAVDTEEISTEDNIKDTLIPESTFDESDKEIVLKKTSQPMLLKNNEAMLLSLNGVTIKDDIKNSGCLEAVVEGEVSEEELTYQWYVLDDNGAWAEIEDSSTVDSREKTYYVARDGAQKTYKVTVTSSDGSYEDSGSFKVEYYDALQNGSFETPVVSETEGYQTYNNAHFIQVPNGTDGLEWKTTAIGPAWNTNLGNDYYIEIADGSKKSYGWWSTNDPSDVYHISSAADGDQFAELNCQVSGALYQDILTQPGSTLYWGLEHAGRGGQDTMAVIISDTKSLPENWNPTEDNYNSRPDDVQATITDGPGTWNYHTGSYTVPEGQYVTRFYFVAVTAVGGTADGNLLDNISFGKDVPNPPASKGNLTIQKKIEGLTAEEVPEESFTFIVTDKSGNMVGEAKLPTSGGEWSYSIPGLEPGEYTIKETTETVEGYTLTNTSHQVGAGNSEAGDSIQVSVVKKETTTVAYTNTYVPATAKLTIQKTFRGLTEDKVRELINEQSKDGTGENYILKFDVNYYLNGTEGETGSYTFRAKDHLNQNASLTGSGTEWVYTYTIPNAALNKYYDISENHYEVNGYQCTAQTEVTGSSVTAIKEQDRADQFRLLGDTTVAFVNTYIRNKDLTVSKTIIGVEPQKVDGLTFAVTGETEGNIAELKLSDMTLTQNADGSCTYTKTLEAVEPDTYTITESNYNVDDYECTTEYQIGTEEKTEGLSANVAVTKEKSASVAFTNTYESLLRTVTIRKLVDGNMGDSNREFDFVVKPGTGVALEESSDLKKNADGTYAFQLKHNESVVLTGLRKGDVLEIWENDYHSDGYKTSVQIGEQRYEDTRQWKTEADGIQENVTLVFTNTKDVITPTGLHDNRAPFVIMLTGAGGIALWFALMFMVRQTLKRRRRG